MDYAERINKHYEHFQNCARDIFAEAAAHFFETNPDIISFGWSQFTPYFNDGEECVFQIPDRDFFINEYNLESCDKEHRPSWFRHPCSIKEQIKSNEINPEVVALLKQELNVAENALQEQERFVAKAKEFLQEFSEQHLQMIFGSHVRVNIQKFGDIKVESYTDHY